MDIYVAIFYINFNLLESMNDLPVAIAIVTIAGFLIAIPSFFLYRIICLSLSEVKFRDLLKNNIFSGNFAELSVMAVISAVILNIMLYRFGYGPQFLAGLVFVYSMLILAAIDLKNPISTRHNNQAIDSIGFIAGLF